ncbi:MAG: mandelate racemase/muconate lactonizing enzyme family protein, partial [Phycisphaerae bacterium]
MKVTDWVVHAPDERFHVFIELRTDEGLGGWGSAYSEREQVLGALAWLKRFVMNENPLELERVTEKLHQVSFWPGRGGAMTHAISGINLALWDLAGQVLEQPVHVLLGGRFHERVPVYGSILFHPVETLGERIERMRARRFRAFKVGWHPFGASGRREDEKLVQAARSAAGDGATLMIDAGGSRPFCPFRLKDALERAKMLADYGVH